MFVVTLPKTAVHDPVVFARKAKNAGADLLEIRGDLTPKILPFDSPLPLIVSPRGTGTRLVTSLHAAYMDLELGEDMDVSSDTKIIRSFHDTEKTPPLADLMEVGKKMEATKPNILKIATKIHSFADLRTLDLLADELPPKQGRCILGMGPKAHLNRLLSPLQNALTYTYVDEGEESALGQIPLSLYRHTARCQTPKIFGLLGGEAAQQSLSPHIHNMLFSCNGIDALYSLFLTDDLDDAFDALMARGIAGFSVTSPFKQAIGKKLDRLDVEAKRLGTVNTVVREDGCYVGHTCDAEGILEGYPFLREKTSVAILGSGGVVPSVIQAVQARGVKDISLFARNATSREAVAKKFGVRHFDLQEIQSTDPDIMISTISHDATIPLPRAKRNAHAIDLRYGTETKFLHDAREAGYAIHDGMAMLIHQAIAQFRLFTGTEPSPQSIDSLLSSFSHYGKQ